ncbi:hypothetical protein GGS23DRAFT_607653 [Durotheca rogersii]|uniref:uncharacterized protein n=1 Tax=Durotheca rogersii TaxID=419775 RepID=UPI00221FA171|nr:uncharacterized protein GGS23DRAFT_607653 [Durotheca rogersii]KAI5859302.1 hypothetical protein GGS23DRAFT_607653 [Durotheca rogersii]
MPKPHDACAHDVLQLELSAYAQKAGFVRTGPNRRLAATTRSGYSPLAKKGQIAARKTLFVAAVPRIAPAWGSWEKGDSSASGKPPRSEEKLTPPSSEGIVRYLSEFYHGLPVKVFPQQLRLLNLGDLLGATIGVLSADAYSIVLLVDHDMYEDEDDDFCCGRAYGGSRAGVVSTSRYNPILSSMAIPRWAYIGHRCEAKGPQPAARKRRQNHAVLGLSGPAVEAATLQEEQPSTPRRGMAEDVRQPSCLCPVCLSKVSHAPFCDSWNRVGFFAGYGAWIRGRLGKLE